MLCFASLPPTFAIIKLVLVRPPTPFHVHNDPTPYIQAIGKSKPLLPNYSISIHL